MINIAICDDNISVTGKMEDALLRFAREKMIDIDSDVYFDGKELADTVINGKRYDIIFLDIEMNEENGLSAAKRIREVDKTVIIIYVTSYESYMKETFEVRPFRFLVKPIDLKELKRYFLEASEEITSGDYYFRYRYERVNYKILVKEILYFESRRRKIFITTTGGTVETYGKLNDIEKSLKGGKIPFLRIHQSYLVNYKHITGQAYDFIILSDGSKLSISEDRRKRISEEYCMLGDGINVD